MRRPRLGQFLAGALGQRSVFCLQTLDGEQGVAGDARVEFGVLRLGKRRVRLGPSLVRGAQAQVGVLALEVGKLAGGLVVACLLYTSRCV